MPEVKILRLSKFNKADSKIKAFVDIKIDDYLVINGLRIVCAEKGYFVAWPRELDKHTGSWKEIILCVKAEIKKKIDDAILSEFFKSANRLPK